MIGQDIPIQVLLLYISQVYTARHTWATLAYYLEVHPGIIREAMGHSSIKVTETYLKPFNIKKLDETNLSIIGYAKRSFEG